MSSQAFLDWGFHTDDVTLQRPKPPPPGHPGPYSQVRLVSSRHVSAHGTGTGTLHGNAAQPKAAISMKPQTETVNKQKSRPVRRYWGSVKLGWIRKSIFLIAKYEINTVQN
jgi:hypothetical protein